MESNFQKSGNNRCLRLLVALALCLGLLWISGYMLVSAIYLGQAGDFLNSLISGQSIHALDKYHADLNRLMLPISAMALAPLLVCIMLPRHLRKTITLGLALMAKTVFRYRHTGMVITLCGLLAFALYDIWESRPIRIPDSYATGAVTLLSGPTDCGGEVCYELEIACPELNQPERASLRVGLPRDEIPGRGTILLLSGWTGNFWWDLKSDNGEDVSVEDRQLETTQKEILSRLQDSGFRTVQLKWARGWIVAEPGSRENLPLLACKPATATRWIYQHIHAQSPGEAFCAGGHSNGATEIAYMLSRYNLGEIISLALMESGPNWSRLDHSCLRDADHPELFGDQNERNTIDMAFGYPNDGSGICARQKKDHQDNFRISSAFVEDAWNYNYPDTRIAIVLGEDDRTITARHAEYYYAQVSSAGSPQLTLDTIPGAGHAVTAKTAGAELIIRKFLDACRPAD